MYIYGKFYAILIYKSHKIYEQYNSLFHDNGHQNSGSNKKKKKERRKRTTCELPVEHSPETDVVQCTVHYFKVYYIISGTRLSVTAQTTDIIHGYLVEINVWLTIKV